MASAGCSLPWVWIIWLGAVLVGWQVPRVNEGVIEQVHGFRLARE